MAEVRPAAIPAPVQVLAQAQVQALPSGPNVVAQATRDRQPAQKEPARSPTSTIASVLPEETNASLAK